MMMKTMRGCHSTDNLTPSMIKIGDSPELRLIVWTRRPDDMIPPP